MATEVDHAKENAAASLSNIREMLARLEHARTCSNSGDEDCDMMLNTGQPDEDGDSIYVWPIDLEWDQDEYHDEEAAQEAIIEDALSVEVRSSWTVVGDELEADEFCLLLTTGGPALRICGDLDEYKQPTRAYMQYQDWGTPWEDYYESGIGATLLAYAQVFYYGD